MIEIKTNAANVINTKVLICPRNFIAKGPCSGYFLDRNALALLNLKTMSGAKSILKAFNFL